MTMNHDFRGLKKKNHKANNVAQSKQICTVGIKFCLRHQKNTDTETVSFS